MTGPVGMSSPRFSTDAPCSNRSLVDAGDRSRALGAGEERKSAVEDLPAANAIFLRRRGVASRVKSK